MVPKPKKSSRKGLTASHPNKASANWTSALDTLDAVNDRCRAIVAVAELLEHSDDCLNPDTVADAGTIIASEARQLRKLLTAALGKIPR